MSAPEQTKTPEQVALEAAHKKIAANFDKTVTPMEFNFTFKSKPLLDADGKETGETSKRAPVLLALPMLSLDGIIAIIESGDAQQQGLLLEAVQKVQYQQAKSLVDEDLNVTADNFPLDKVTWQFIANLPKAERTGGGIAKETWEAFGVAYCADIQAIAGKTLDQAKKAADLLVAKFVPVKTNKKVIKLLQAQLGMYMEAEQSSAADYIECVEFLLKKANTLLEAPDEDLLSAL